MEKEIKLVKQGEVIQVTEKKVYSCDSMELLGRIRAIDAEKDSLVKRSQELKRRYTEIDLEQKKLQEAFNNLEKPTLEEL